MRNLLTIFTLIFTVMFSSPSYSEWTKVGKTTSGQTHYVDFERIRKHDGYVYYWFLGDFLKPDKQGELSGKIYYQGDCKLFRFKSLSYSFHKEPMGQGTPSTSSNQPYKEWTYPPPNSAGETILKKVCSR